MVHEDVIAAAAVLARVELTGDGAQTVYEVRRDGTDEGLLWASTDVDEVLAYLRGRLTGKEPPEEEA